MYHLIYKLRQWLVALAWCGFILSIPSISWAALALVNSECLNSTTLYGGGTTYTHTYAFTPTANNLVVVYARTPESRTLNSVAGSTHSYTLGSPIQHGGTLQRDVQGYVIWSGSDTTTTFTLSANEITSISVVCFLEFSGANSSQSGTSQSAVFTTTTTIHDTGTVTPATADNVFVYSSSRVNRTYTEDTGSWVSLYAPTNRIQVSYWIQSAATAQIYNLTSTTNADVTQILGSFLGASAGSSPVIFWGD